MAVVELRTLNLFDQQFTGAPLERRIRKESQRLAEYSVALLVDYLFGLANARRLSFIKALYGISTHKIVATCVAVYLFFDKRADAVRVALGDRRGRYPVVLVHLCLRSR